MRLSIYFAKHHRIGQENGLGTWWGDHFEKDKFLPVLEEGTNEPWFQLPLTHPRDLLGSHTAVCDDCDATQRVTFTVPAFFWPGHFLTKHVLNIFGSTQKCDCGQQEKITNTQLSIIPDCMELDGSHLWRHWTFINHRFPNLSVYENLQEVLLSLIGLSK